MSLSTEIIGFDQLPQAVATLLEEVRDLKSMISDTLMQKTETESNPWLNLTELCDYLPDHPSKQTVYGWVSNRQIPYYKVGRRLSFSKKEIDVWISGAYKQTAEQLHQQALKTHGYRKGGLL